MFGLRPYYFIDSFGSYSLCHARSFGKEDLKDKSIFFHPDDHATTDGMIVYFENGQSQFVTAKQFKKMYTKTRGKTLQKRYKTR